MRIENTEKIQGFSEAIQDFMVLSRLLEKKIEQIGHCVYSLKGSDDKKLLELEGKYISLMEEFKNLQI